MTSYVPSWRNFVNLGNLYSVRPWENVTAKDFPTISHNSVNLGRLYAPVRLTKKRPLGWGYFDDGSVFIAPRTYMNHDAFEARMKLAAHFVSSPSPKLQAIRQEDVHRKRLIVIR